MLRFDLSPSAIATAQRRADVLEDTVAVEFVEASATDLDEASRVQAVARELGGFRCALDVGLLHCLDDAAQRAYVDGLRPLLRRGGKVFVGCFSDANPDPWLNPRRMSKDELRALFCEERSWQIVSLTETWFERPAEQPVQWSVVLKRSIALAAGGRLGLAGAALVRGGRWTIAWWCIAEAI